MSTYQELVAKMDSVLNYIQNFLAIQNGSPESIIAFYTFILAIFTAVLAVFTVFLWWESRKNRLFQQTPQVSLIIDRILDSLILRIKNSGSRDAKDVDIKMSMKCNNIGSNCENNYNYNYFPSGQEFRYIIGGYPYCENATILVEMTYKSLFGNKKTNSFSISLKEFENGLSVEKDLEKISSSMSSIWRLLNSVISDDYKEKNIVLPEKFRKGIRIWINEKEK